MNTASILHRTAMELYELANIYKAKGETQSFDDYKNRAWHLEQEAALQLLSVPEDFTFKYLVVNSAGQLGYEVGEYAAAQKMLELGLMQQPDSLVKHEMERLLKQIKEKTNTPIEQATTSISGTLTAADIEQNHISIRESKSRQVRSIPVPLDMIKRVIRYYLGELVTIQLTQDETGAWQVLEISKVA